jgi:uncharacterized protein YndB with AHSA1/START domain
LKQVSEAIHSTRVFGVSRERLFEAFRDPSQLARWWGPERFTNTFAEFDLRPGGFWRFTMHGPGGTDYPNTNEFTEVDPPARVAFIHRAEVRRFRMTIDFTDEDQGARLTWRMVFEDPDEAVKLRDFILGANEQNFDRLEAVLAGG